MKNARNTLLWITAVAAGPYLAQAQPADLPEDEDAADVVAATEPSDDAADTVVLDTPEAVDEESHRDSPEVEARPVRTSEFTVANPGVAAMREAGDDGPADLRLNFRGVPLEMVLNYLSEAAGFIIVPEAEIRGKVDVWSNQPLTKTEAVDVLNSVLNKNGYAALRNGRTLTIVSREEARKRDIPVVSGNDPADIPRTDEIVTQVIPVRYINAVQLTKDLQPLLPEKAALTANEAGNALVLTDTRASIRRMTEIIRALDTSIASLSSVRVFPLQSADAKEVATMIKELFQTANNAGNNENRNRIQNLFRGGGIGPGGAGGGGGGGNAAASSNAGRAGASSVTAVADERSNSLVVGAPDEVMPTIEELVKSVDTPVEDVTELRVFRLKYSDATEMAELLTQLFPDETQNNTTRSAGIQFGGGPFGRPGGQNNRNNNASQPSERMKKQSRVIAVPDPRTGSIIVTAARNLMGQIAQMIEQLDENPARRQKVFVYSLENADVQSVEEILRGLFENQNAVNNRRTTTQQTPSALNNRANNQQNQGVGGGQNTGFGQGPQGGGQGFQ